MPVALLFLFKGWNKYPQGSQCGRCKRKRKKNYARQSFRAQKYEINLKMLNRKQSQNVIITWKNERKKFYENVSETTSKQLFSNVIGLCMNIFRYATFNTKHTKALVGIKELLISPTVIFTLFFCPLQQMTFHFN
jgi:hypothetical protein